MLYTKIVILSNLKLICTLFCLIGGIVYFGDIKLCKITSYEKLDISIKLLTIGIILYFVKFKTKLKIKILEFNDNDEIIIGIYNTYYRNLVIGNFSVTCYHPDFDCKKSDHDKERNKNDPYITCYENVFMDSKQPFELPHPYKFKISLHKLPKLCNRSKFTIYIRLENPYWKSDSGTKQSNYGENIIDFKLNTKNIFNYD